MPAGLQLLLGFADRGDLRERVDDARDDVVVHVARLSRQHLGDGDALVLGLVGEHRPAHHVADGVDAGHVGREVVVDDDAAALGRDAGRFQAEAVRVGTPPRRDQHDIGEQVLARAARDRLEMHAAAALVLDHLGHLRRQMELEALLLQHALELLGDFPVHARQDAVEIFDHRHLGAEPRARPSRVRGR